MPPTVAQDVASIIATRAESFLEQYEGSGVIDLTSAQKQALVSQLQGRQNCFTLQGKKISLYTDPEWRSSAENVGKRWITVVTYESQCKLGRGSARYWGGQPYSSGAAADEPPKRGSISRNRREHNSLFRLWPV